MSNAEPPIMDDRREELLEAWRTNNRINLILLDHITEEGLRCTLSTRGGRDVARQFAHLHNVRIWHLEKRAKDLVDGLETFASKDSPSRERLAEALTASALAVETFLGDVLEGKPRRRGFKKGIFTTLSYFVAHESHHRGSILLTLKQSGHAVDRDVAYGIWDWDRR
jgi:uncharacterized damage-inducible protein DinB